MSAGALETLVTAAAHASTGYTIGNVVDALFPKYDANRSDTRTAIEVLGQFGLGYLAMLEAMQTLIPNTSSYVVPIGDGIGVTFFFYAQPEFWKKIYHLTDKVRRITRKVENKAKKDLHYLDDKDGRGDRGDRV